MSFPFLPPKIYQLTVLSLEDNEEDIKKKISILRNDRETLRRSEIRLKKKVTNSKTKKERSDIKFELQSARADIVENKQDEKDLRERLEDIQKKRNR